MSFNPKVTLLKFSQSPPPVMPGTRDAHIDRELRKLSAAVESIVQAVEEIRNYLKNP